jgi:hypothetical protein
LNQTRCQVQSRRTLARRIDSKTRRPTLCSKRKKNEDNANSFALMGV